MVGRSTPLFVLPLAGAVAAAFGGVLLRLGVAAAAGFAVLLLLGLVASVLAVGLLLSAPARAAVGAPPSDLPGTTEDVAIPSASGAALRGWYAAPPQARGGVVLLHGAWSDRSMMLRRARLLSGQGFAVLLFDFQAHGESPGRRITFGKLEALDARAALRFMRERHPAERVGVIGVSLGGAAALLGPEPLDADALVLESVYPDIAGALANRLRVGLGPVLGPAAAPWLGALFLRLLPPLLGVRRQDLRPIARVGAVRAPLLVASGAEDDRTTIAEARELFTRAPGPKRFWAVPGVGHVDLEAHDPEGYRRVVLGFLADTLRRPEAGG